MKTLYSLGGVNQKAEQWGLWACGDGLGASRLRTGSGVKPDITDAEGLEFDGFVRKLAERDNREFYIVKNSYVYRKSLSEIAIELRCSVALVRQKHQAALAFLDGAVSVSSSFHDRVA